jgi:hypothetical protein
MADPTDAEIEWYNGLRGRRFGDREICPGCPHVIVGHDQELGCAWCECPRWTAGELYPWESERMADD